ncbi:YaaA family protein [Odoribacter laneus]|uniref:YaaA family protein n=1 Tax=Odoribacter laneus TaxID=626933 RepID=UPI003995043E
MIIILSPAKSMDMSITSPLPQGTVPRFQKEAEYIASQIQDYSRDQLQTLLQISNKLTDINYERYQEFDRENTPAKPAILAYTGNVFQHIRPETFTQEDFQYAQKHLRIISTLYGLLRPLDLIKAYRIAFKIKIRGMQESNLYEYWRPKLTEPLIKEANQDDKIIINLASLDVLGALQIEKIQSEVRMITPEFKELRKGKYETIRTYAKMARGEMTRYILLNRIEKPERIQEFEWDGFRYCAELSEKDNYVWTR